MSVSRIRQRENRGLPFVGRDLHPRLDAVQRVDDRQPIEARLFDPIVAGAAGRLEADRPGRFALLADIEEVAARLQRIERPADEIDRAAAPLGAHDEGRAPAVAQDFKPDRAVVEDVSVGPAREFGRRALRARERASRPSGGPWPRMATEAAAMIATAAA